MRRRGKPGFKRGTDRHIEMSTFVFFFAFLLAMLASTSSNTIPSTTPGTDQTYDIDIRSSVEESVECDNEICTYKRCVDGNCQITKCNELKNECHKVEEVGNINLYKTKSLK